MSQQFFGLYRQGMPARLGRFGKYIGAHDLLLAVTVTAAVILAGITLGVSNNGVVLSYPILHYHYTAEPNNPLSFLSNWDGPDYLQIVHYGYHNLFDANFFPFYPLLIYIVSFSVRSALVSALLVAWACMVGALYFYIKIIKHLFDSVDIGESLKALSFFVLFPSGVFLIGTYTESLYALLALGAIYYALQRKYIWSALLLLPCTATHITGVFVVALIAMMMLEQKERWWKAVATAAVGSLGLLGYMFYVWRRFHDPIAFITAQRQIHGWVQHSPMSILTRADPLNVVFIVLLVMAAIYWWNRRKSFAVYSLLFLAIPLVGHQYGGFNRYVLMAFPLQFMLYAYVRDKKQAYPYVLLLFGVVWTYFALQYFGGYIGN